MKRNKTCAILSALLALMLCLSACGSNDAAEMFSTAAYSNSYSSQRYDMAPVAAAPAETESSVWMEEDGAALANGVSSDAMRPDAADRKIVYTGSMELETKQFDEAIGQIAALVEENGGYISSQEISGQSLSWSGNYYERYAWLTVRVPAAQFDGLMTGVSGVCNVTGRSVWTDDISDTYYDAQAHLDTLNLQEERLLEILSKAEKLEDVITLEQALSEVRYEIESLTARLRRMDDQVDYSTLTLTVSEVVEYSELEKKPATFGERLSGAAKRSGEKIVAFFQDLALWAVEDLPVLLLWLILFGAVLWALVKVLRRFRRTPENRRPLWRFQKKQEQPAVKKEEKEE